MNLAHVHLILNHIPVIGMGFGVLLLLVSIARRSGELMKVSLALFLLLSLTALPVFFTGEPAEEVVEHLPGVAESFIDQHEDAAKVALAAIEILGLVALGGLVFFRQASAFPQWYVATSLMLSLVVGGLMTRAANLGGQIHHTEIREGAAASVSSTDPSSTLPAERHTEEGSAEGSD